MTTEQIKRTWREDIEIPGDAYALELFHIDGDKAFIGFKTDGNFNFVQIENSIEQEDTPDNNTRLQCLEIASKLKTFDDKPMTTKELLGKAEELLNFINQK